jgi:hypothetical protein
MRKLALAAVTLACALIACRGARAGGAVDGGPVEAAAARDARGAADGGDAGRVVGAAAPQPQDEGRPPPSSEELTARARHLVEAIAHDDATLASDIMFPRDAWLATRDAADPGKDWSRRVVAPFRKGVHALARRGSGSQGRAQLVSFELGHAVVQAVPKRRGWKKPLWTVRGSRLTYSVGGRSRVVFIREMTAWRGAWYVTRLR